jgi:hypothetical protein
MKTWSMYLSLLIILPVMAQTTGPKKKDWDAEFETLKTYDRDFASRLKTEEGSWVKPKPEIVAVLKKLKEPIKTAGQEMGVDPRAIAGCILAENTMNVGVSDQVQDWLVKVGMAKKASIGGKKFTIGLGQLNFDVARRAEDYGAKIEKRKPLSDAELQEALLDPEQSVKLIAQVLRKIQDTYKAQGFDISKKPEILTTVYNLGKEEQKAKKSKAKNRLPRANFFGFFVDKYIGTIEGAVGKNTEIAKAKPVTPTAREKNTVAVNITPQPKTNTNIKKSKIKLSKQKVLQSSMPLMQSPPTCEKEGYGYDPNKRYNSYKNYAVSGIADKGNTWKLLTPSIDCESQEWSLIRTDSGMVGWIKTEDLEKNTVSEFHEEKKCKSTQDSKCKESVEHASAGYVSKETNTTQLSYLNPIASEGNKANFKNRNKFCPSTANEKSIPAVPSATATPSSKIGYSGLPVVAKGKEMNKIADLEKSYKKIEKKLNEFGDFSDPYHPYQFSAKINILNQNTILKNFRSCINDQKAKVSNCNLDLALLDSTTNMLKFNKNPSLKDADALYYQFEALNSLIPSSSIGMGMKIAVKSWAGTEQEIENIDQAKSIQLLEACRAKVQEKQLSRSVAILDRTIEDTKTYNAESWKLNQAARYNAVNIVKFCSESLDLFYNETIDSKHKSSLCDVKAADLQYQNFKVISKAIFKKQFTQPSDIDRYFADIEAWLQPTKLPTAINTKGAGILLAELGGSDGDYCPNRTAEYIDELLTNHPCIKKIYVPDPWLLDRLNQHQSKIVYRPFEKDDIYAVDYSEESCK